MAGQLYGSTMVGGMSVGDFIGAYTRDVLPVIGYVEIWSSINGGYHGSTLLGTYKYVSGSVKIDRSNINRRTATDITLLNDPANDPSNLLLPVAGTAGGQMTPYGNEMKIFKGVRVTVVAAKSSWFSGNTPTFPFTVTTGVNDTFTGSAPGFSGGETFTVAAGIYADITSFMAALNAATGSLSGEPFSTYAMFTYSGGSGTAMSWNVVGSAPNGTVIADTGGGGVIAQWISDGIDASFILDGGADASVTDGYAQEGVFLIEGVKIINDSKGLVFKGTMNDRMEWISRLSFHFPFSIGPSVGNVTDAIYLLMANASSYAGYFAVPVPVGVTDTIPNPSPVLHYSIGDDPAKCMTDLAGAYGCALYFDAFGALNLEYVPDPVSILPCVEYLEGTSASSIAIERDLDSKQVPNIIAVETAGTKASAAKTVFWWDSYPGSPSYYAPEPFSWTTPQLYLPANAGNYSILLQKFTTTISQGDIYAAQAMALAIGLTSIGSLEKSTFTLRDQPAHDVDDVIMCLRVIAGIPADVTHSLPGFKYILDQVIIDLSADGQGVQAVGRLVWYPPS